MYREAASCLMPIFSCAKAARSAPHDFVEGGLVESPGSGKDTETTVKNMGANFFAKHLSLVFRYF